MKTTWWLSLLFAALLAAGGCNAPKDAHDHDHGHDHSHDGHDHGHDHAHDSKPAETTDPNIKVSQIDEKVGDGPTAETGDLVTVNYVGTFTDGEIFDTNKRAQGDPFSFILGSGQVIKGWDQGVAGMKVGGKRVLDIPYQLAYGEKGQPPTIPPKSPLHFEVELLDVVKKGDEGVWEKDPSFEKAGTGPAIQKGDTVTIHYLGKLVNGKKFDSSRDRGEPFTFQVGDEQVILGFDEAVIGMQAGGKRKVRIPPMLAYGPMGKEGSIPANAVLIFEIEIVKVKKP